MVAAAAARWLKATTATDSRAARGDAEGGELESPVVADVEGETMKTMGRARWRVWSRSLQVETFLTWCLPLL